MPKKTKHALCEMLPNLKWQRAFHPAGWAMSYANVGRQRAIKLQEAAGINLSRLRARVPSPGYERMLGQCNGNRIWLVNRGGRLSIEKR